MNRKSRWRRLLCLMLATLLLLSACSSPAPAPKEEEPQPEENKPAEYFTYLTDDAEIPSGLPSLAVELPAYTGKRAFQGLTYDEILGLTTCATWTFLTWISARWKITTTFLSARAPSGRKNCPQGSDPDAILELGKNPGLGIRDIHAQGITGKGVSIAIIDQALYTGHQEYKDNLMTSEWIHKNGPTSQMHGSGVCSIAAGREVRGGPRRQDLLHLHFLWRLILTEPGEEFLYDQSLLADCIRRVLAINQHLPEEDKIRVISVSLGYTPEKDLGVEVAHCRNSRSRRCRASRPYHEHMALL